MKRKYGVSKCSIHGDAPHLLSDEYDYELYRWFPTDICRYCMLEDKEKNQIFDLEAIRYKFSKTLNIPSLIHKIPKNIEGETYYSSYLLKLYLPSKTPKVPNSHGKIVADKGNYFHRIFVICDCGKEVPFGRMHKHKNSDFHNKLKLNSVE